MEYRQQDTSRVRNQSPKSPRSMSFAEFTNYIEEIGIMQTYWRDEENNLRSPSKLVRPIYNTQGPEAI